jgi:hypothetical protein
MNQKRKNETKSSASQNTHLSPTRIAQRYLVAIVASIAAIASAAILTTIFAVGLPPDRFTALDGIGRIEVLRMPVGARRLIDVKSFVIKMPGADDYGRVFANNYLVLNKEAQDIFYTQHDDARKKDAITSDKAQRNVNLLGDNDIKGYLRTGSNIIVAELENAVGPCTFGIDIHVNGIELETFPRTIPDKFFAEKESVNSTLFQKFEKAQAMDTSAGYSTPDPYDDVVCARRIFQVDLE